MKIPLDWRSAAFFAWEERRRRFRQLICGNNAFVFPVNNTGMLGSRQFRDMGTDFLRDEDAANLTPLSHIVRLGNRGELEQFGPYGGDWTIGPSRSGPIDEIDGATRRDGARKGKTERGKKSRLGSNSSLLDNLIALPFRSPIELPFHPSDGELILLRRSLMWF